MKNKKYILMLLLFIIIIALTYYNIFKKSDINTVLEDISKLSIKAILICSTFIIIYFLLQAIYMKITLKSLKVKVPFLKCIYYCLVEFYFSGITPSSTGGQPMQLYYMTKDNIPMRKGYITLMLNTIYFKLIIFIMGIVSFFFTKEQLLDNKVYLVFFILGIVVDFFIIVVLSLLMFKQKVIKKVLGIIIKATKRFSSKISNFNINDFLKKYSNELIYIKNNKKIVVINIFITLVQRLLLFSIAYILYRDLGFTKYNYITLLMIQISVQTSIEALPLPGGSGLSENMLKSMFATIFSIKLCDTAMILTRTFSFYIPLVISGTIILITRIIKPKQKILETI